MVGFGGDMEPDSLSDEERRSMRKLWGEICKSKIDEAFEDYMKKSGLNDQKQE